MYSSDFDYDGMLRKGSRVTVKTNLTSLNKLHDSFEDVNYHTQCRKLWTAIKYLTAIASDLDADNEEELKNAEKSMNDFNQSCKDEMREQGIKF